MLVQPLTRGDLVRHPRGDPAGDAAGAGRGRGSRRRTATPMRRSRSPCSAIAGLQLGERTRTARTGRGSRGIRRAAESASGTHRRAEQQQAPACAVVEHADHVAYAGAPTRLEECPVEQRADHQTPLFRRGIPAAPRAWRSPRSCLRTCRASATMVLSSTPIRSGTRRRGSCRRPRSPGRRRRAARRPGPAPRRTGCPRSYGRYSAAIASASFPNASSKICRSTVRATSASGSSVPTASATNRPVDGCASRAVAVRARTVAVVQGVRDHQNSFATISVVRKYRSVNSTTARGSNALQV